MLGLQLIHASKRATGITATNTHNHIVTILARPGSYQRCMCYYCIHIFYHFSTLRCHWSLGQGLFYPALCFGHISCCRRMVTIRSSVLRFVDMISKSGTTACCCHRQKRIHTPGQALSYTVIYTLSGEFYAAVRWHQCGTLYIIWARKCTRVVFKQITSLSDKNAMSKKVSIIASTIPYNSRKRYV